MSTGSETMIEVRNTLDIESLRRLAGLRGASLCRMFGVNLDVCLMSEDVSFETDFATITVWGGIDRLDDWEGFEGQYSVLHIDEGVPRIYAETDVVARDMSSEGSFFFHAGDRIQDVSIVREYVRKVVTGAVEWEYTTDTAVVIELSNGVLAISKAALDGEMLNVTITDCLEQLTIPPAGAFWFHWNVMGTEFQRSGERLSIEDLVYSEGV